MCDTTGYHIVYLDKQFFGNDLDSAKCRLVNLFTFDRTCD